MTSTSTIAPLLVGSAEAARLLGGISQRTLWAWTMPRGTIPSVKTPGGRLVLYSMDALRKWIDDATSAPSEGEDL